MTRPRTHSDQQLMAGLAICLARLHHRGGCEMQARSDSEVDRREAIGRLPTWGAVMPPGDGASRLQRQMKNNILRE